MTDGERMVLAKGLATAKCAELPRKELVALVNNEDVSIFTRGAAWRMLVEKFHCSECGMVAGRVCHCDPSLRGALVQRVA